MRGTDNYQMEEMPSNEKQETLLQISIGYNSEDIIESSHKDSQLSNKKVVSHILRL